MTFLLNSFPNPPQFSALISISSSPAVMVRRPLAIKSLKLAGICSNVTSFNSSEVFKTGCAGTNGIIGVVVAVLLLLSNCLPNAEATDSNKASFRLMVSLLNFPQIGASLVFFLFNAMSSVIHSSAE